jgi:hypothetical protein
MPTTITASRAIEQSTFVVTAAFTDESGDAVTPNAVTWTLSKTDGTAINSREDESITPAASVNIVLSGDDLQVFSGDNYQRVLTLKGDYNSDLGNNLPLNDELYFSVEDLVNVS